MSNRRYVVPMAILTLCSSSALVRAQDGSPVSADAVDERSVVTLAQRQSPTIKAALLDAQSARQDELRLEAQYTPLVQLDGSYTQTKTPSPYNASSITKQQRGDVGAQISKHFLWGTDLSLRVAGSIQEFTFPARGGAIMGIPTAVAGTFGPSYGILAKLTLKQPLLRGRGREVAEADLNAARVQRGASEQTRDRVASEQLRDSLVAYWELWYAGRALEIQERARDVAKRQRDEAQARADTGGLAPVEVLSFESQLASREEDIVASQAELTRAQLELTRLLGAREPLVGLRAAEDQPVLAGVPDREWLGEEALRASLELQERAAALELARVRARTAGEPNRQRLDLDSYVQAQGLGNEDVSKAFGQVGRMAAVSAFVSLTYEAPLNSRAQKAAEAKARIDVEAAEQELAAARQRVLADINKAYEQDTATERRLELATQTAAIAERQRVAEEARYRTGAATALQVLEAEERVRSAQLRVARAKADLAQGALSISHLTGQLLSRWANR